MPVGSYTAGVITRPLSSADTAGLQSLIADCRGTSGSHGYPQPDDVPSVVAHPAVTANGKVWLTDADMVAWALAQPDFGNVLFDVGPSARTAPFEDEVLGLALQRLATVGVATADTPVESDDGWRQDVLARNGFGDSGDSVVHLLSTSPGKHPAAPAPPGLQVQELGDRVHDYVDAHRAAFGTQYLTAEVRLAWQVEPGYDPRLDLVLVDEADRIRAFAVSYLHGDVGEIGTVGVLPELKGQGLSLVVVAAALDRLVAAGATSVTMSTASTNAPMLATARRTGFSEVRRTTWWHRASTD